MSKMTLKLSLAVLLISAFQPFAMAADADGEAANSRWICFAQGSDHNLRPSQVIGSYTNSEESARTSAISQCTSEGLYFCQVTGCSSQPSN